MFTPNSKLVNAITTKDFTTIRAVLISFMDIDPKGTSDFKDALKYVESNFDITTGFYNENDIIQPKDEKDWNEEYYWEIKSDLSIYFSTNRIRLLLDIAKKLYNKTDRFLIREEKTHIKEFSELDELIKIKKAVDDLLKEKINNIQNNPFDQENEIRVNALNKLYKRLFDFLSN